MKRKQKVVVVVVMDAQVSALDKVRSSGGEECWSCENRKCILVILNGGGTDGWGGCAFSVVVVATVEVVIVMMVLVVKCRRCRRLYGLNEKVRRHCQM